MSGLGQSIFIQQTQTTVLSPQMLQAVRILQMSGEDLDNYLSSEAEQNPLLDVSPAATPENASDEPLETAGDADVPADSTVPGPTVADQEWRLGQQHERGITGPTSEMDAASRSPHREGLYSHLQRLIEGAFRDPVDSLIAEALLGAVDPCGYVDLDMASLAAKLGCQHERVERVLSQCQRMAPTGVFARTLAECLSLQLAERDRLDLAMQRLLANLSLVASKQIDALVQICGVDRADVLDMYAELKTLDPKPGLALSCDPMVIRVPDVLVLPSKDDEGWIVELNPDALPRMIVNRSYYQKLSGSAKTPSDRQYLTDQLQKASWIEKSLDQRANTVLKVACEVIRWQSDFLRKGVEALRPLRLSTIAEALHMHESTISRAAAHKTMLTPRGLFDFRHFFNNAVGSDDGEGHTPQFIQHQIRKMLSLEPGSKVMSDGQIASMLKRDGISIARRTVAKYRENMNIAPSHERRRLIGGN